jgi:hypothetical protein
VAGTLPIADVGTAAQPTSIRHDGDRRDDPLRKPDPSPTMRSRRIRRGARRRAPGDADAHDPAVDGRPTRPD